MSTADEVQGPDFTLACLGIDRDPGCSSRARVHRSELFVFRPGFPLDDAWIHQTYARNLALLAEWAFIPGQLSAGSTSPLWTILLAPGTWIGLALTIGPGFWVG